MHWSLSIILLLILHLSHCVTYPNNLIDTAPSKGRADTDDDDYQYYDPFDYSDDEALVEKVANSMKNSKKDKPLDTYTDNDDTRSISEDYNDIDTLFDDDATKPKENHNEVSDTPGLFYNIKTAADLIESELADMGISNQFSSDEKLNDLLRQSDSTASPKHPKQSSTPMQKTKVTTGVNDSSTKGTDHNSSSEEASVAKNQTQEPQKESLSSPKPSAVSTTINHTHSIMSEAATATTTPATTSTKAATTTVQTTAAAAASTTAATAASTTSATAASIASAAATTASTTAATTATTAASTTAAKPTKATSQQGITTPSKTAVTGTTKPASSTATTKKTEETTATVKSATVHTTVAASQKSEEKKNTTKAASTTASPSNSDGTKIQSKTESTGNKTDSRKSKEETKRDSSTSKRATSSNTNESKYTDKLSNLKRTEESVLKDSTPSKQLTLPGNTAVPQQPTEKDPSVSTKEVMIRVDVTGKDTDNKVSIGTAKVQGKETVPVFSKVEDTGVTLNTESKKLDTSFGTQAEDVSLVKDGNTKDTQVPKDKSLLTENTNTGVGLKGSLLGREESQVGNMSKSQSLLKEENKLGHASTGSYLPKEEEKIGDKHKDTSLLKEDTNTDTASKDTRVSNVNTKSNENVKSDIQSQQDSKNCICGKDIQQTENELPHNSNAEPAKGEVKSLRDVVSLKKGRNNRQENPLRPNAKRENNFRKSAVVPVKQPNHLTVPVAAKRDRYANDLKGRGGDRDDVVRLKRLDHAWPLDHPSTYGPSSEQEDDEELSNEFSTSEVISSRTKKDNQAQTDQMPIVGRRLVVENQVMGSSNNPNTNDQKIDNENNMESINSKLDNLLRVVKEEGSEREDAISSGLHAVKENMFKNEGRINGTLQQINDRLPKLMEALRVTQRAIVAEIQQVMTTLRSLHDYVVYQKTSSGTLSQGGGAANFKPEQVPKA